jgi:Zn-dependent protease with chaperone function
MDFFQHQAKAKSRTLLLVVLYSLGLLGLTATIAVAALMFFAFAETEPDPAIILLCVGGVLLLVIGGSLFKTAELSSGGGRAVAESLGGRQVFPSSTDPAERRLHNVVEEMALAAGIPIPALYIMDNERSINAFAAGFSPNAAVIGVNRGTVELLTRDELQGVIAHEFSHILNGDMRMNLRLIGILFGLQLLALVGYSVIRVIRYAPVSSGRGRGGKGGGGAIILAILAAGVVLMVIGYIGVFFSALIQAAISRQREFLADASAVQFTRNPDGIAGALKKIGAPSIGSVLLTARAAEMSHLFFGNASGFSSLGGLLATHPDITTRIKRIDPRFDGKFPKRSDIQPPKTSNEFSRKLAYLSPRANQTASVQPTTDSKQSVMEHIGGLNIENVLAAGAMLQAIPQNVSASASNPLTAQAVFFALLLDADEIIRNRQLNQIQTKNQREHAEFLLKETLRLYPQIGALPEHEKIPLAQRVSASLRAMTPTQYKKFSEVLDLLIAANNKMDLFEYTIKAMLLRDLDIYFGVAKQLCVRHTSLEQVRLPIRSVVSFLAYSGHDNRPDTEGAFSAAMKELGLTDAILSPSETTSAQFERSLRVLAETSPILKKQIFSAFMTCVWYDGKIVPKEAGLIRAIAAMMAIPIPVLA